MSRSFKYSLLKSFLCHCIPIVLFILLVGGGDGNAKKKGQTPGQLAPPPNQTQEIDVVRMGGFKQKKKKVKKKKNKDECVNSFGGIGVVISLLTGRVMEAMPGYPAERNGIRMDDIILNDESLVGPIGESVEVHYSRDGVEYVVTIVREKICLSKKVP